MVLGDTTTSPVLSGFLAGLLAIDLLATKRASQRLFLSEHSAFGATVIPAGPGPLRRHREDGI
jgi:hypothetical protein